MRRNAGWNFWVNIGDLSFVNLAGSFVFISTILPLYVSYLTESRVLIGLIPAVYIVASHVPQLLMAARAESLERKKPWIVRISVFERVPWLILALGILLWPTAPAWFSYAFLVAMLLFSQGAVGVASPAWRAMLANIIHPDRKGLMFGLGSAFGGLMGAAGALLAGHILDTVAFPAVVRAVLPAGLRRPGDLLELPDAEPRAAAPGRPSPDTARRLSEGTAGGAAGRPQLRALPGEPAPGDLGHPGSHLLHCVWEGGIRQQRRLRRLAYHGRADEPGPRHAAAGLVGRPLRPPFGD